MRSANILLDPMTNRIMVVDFGCALLLEQPGVPLGQLIPNKRRWKVDEGMKDKADGQRIACSQKRRTFSEDIRDAKWVFRRAAS